MMNSTRKFVWNRRNDMVLKPRQLTVVICSAILLSSSVAFGDGVKVPDRDLDLTKSSLEQQNDNQKQEFADKKNNEGWVGKGLQFLHGVIDNVTSNRCFDGRVDKILDQKPVTNETVKEGDEAIAFNKTCEKVGVPVVGGLAAFGAGVATGGFGAPVVYGLATGAAADLLVEGTDTIGNNHPFGPKEIAGAAIRGAVLGYGGAGVGDAAFGSHAQPHAPQQPGGGTTPGTTPPPVTPPPVTPPPVAPPEILL